MNKLSTNPPFFLSLLKIQVFSHASVPNHTTTFKCDSGSSSICSTQAVDSDIFSGDRPLRTKIWFLESFAARNEVCSPGPVRKVTWRSWTDASPIIVVPSGDGEREPAKMDSHKNVAMAAAPQISQPSGSAVTYPEPPARSVWTGFSHSGKRLIWSKEEANSATMTVIAKTTTAGRRMSAGVRRDPTIHARFLSNNCEIHRRSDREYLPTVSSVPCIRVIRRRTAGRSNLFNSSYLKKYALFDALQGAGLQERVVSSFSCVRPRSPEICTVPPANTKEVDSSAHEHHHSSRSINLYTEKIRKIRNRRKSADNPPVVYINPERPLPH